MSEERMRGDGAAILEVERKIRLSIAVVAFVVLTLFGIALYHLVPPAARASFSLPAISLNLISAISFFLALVGLGLSIRISRQVMRIIRDYSRKLERLLDITCDLREEIYGDILLEKILDSAMSITNADAGSILLLEGKSLIFKIVRGGGTRGLRALRLIWGEA